MNRPIAIFLTLIFALAVARGAREGEIKPGDLNPQVLYDAPMPKPAPTPAAAPSLFPTPPPFATPAPFGAPPSTSGTLAAEIEGIGEELSFLAVTSFQPGGEGAPGSPTHQPWTPTRLANPELNRALAEFAGSAPMAEEEKVVRITNEAFVAKGAPIGDTVRLNETYKDIRTALNDHSAGPMTEEDLDELVGLLNSYLGPIRVRHAGMGFGSEDYCFKSVFETTERKFRLNILRHAGSYLWFVEDVL